MSQNKLSESLFYKSNFNHIDLDLLIPVYKFNNSVNIFNNIYDNHFFRKLIFSPTINDDIFKNYLLKSYDLYMFLMSKLKNMALYYKKDEYELKNYDPNKNTLFLDIDETLVHSNLNATDYDFKIDMKYDKYVPIMMENFEPNITKKFEPKMTMTGSFIVSLPVKIRPGLHYFLENVSKYYQIYIFTAASSEYAKKIVNNIDPMNKFIKDVYSKNHCIPTKFGFLVKMLLKFKNLNIKKTLIVDNMLYSFIYNIGNGVPILDFKGNNNDTELFYLTNYLINISTKENISESNLNYFKLFKLSEYSRKNIV